MGCIEISHEISRSHHANLYHQWLGVDQFLGKLIVYHVTFTHSPRLIHYSISAGSLLVGPWGTENLQVITTIYHSVRIASRNTQIAAALHLTASGDRQAAGLQ